MHTMKFNADLSQRACENIDKLEWEESSTAGVQRLRLERDDEQPPVERVTTVVRFAPGSSFAQNDHEGGEEFLVLDGTLSDQYGNYPTGTYGRNPKGTGHAPFSDDGCIMLVKLWQMHPDDQQQLAINTRDEALWQKRADGSDALPLFEGDYESVCMLRWPAGLSIKERQFDGGVEYFVLAGSFHDQDGVYKQGSWLRLPPGSRQTIHVDTQCMVYRKSGHLLNRVPYV
jgi:anti-sigma factor ChrR (cupin superfamily)